MKFHLVTILIFVLSPLESSFSSSESANSSDYMAVKSVVDGDTFWADDGSPKGLKIRLIGVDAPESRVSGQKQIGYYGQQSKDFLTKMIGGKKIRLEYDVDRTDRYDRTLAYVYLPDGTFVNAELVKRGYAMVMTVPPNVKYAEKFVRWERMARNASRGLWKETE